MMTDTTRYSGIKMGQTIRTRGLRYNWVAEQLGVSKATMSKWVNGNRGMSHPMAIRAANLLGVPFDLLFDSPKGNDDIPERNAA